MFGGIVSSPLNILSPTQALELAHVYLENASTAKDPMVALVLCHDTETSLSQARRSTKNAQAPSLREKIANAYIELGRFLNSCGHGDEAQSSFKKAESMGGRLQRQMDRLVPYPVLKNRSSLPTSMLNSSAPITHQHHQRNSSSSSSSITISNDNNIMVPLHVFTHDIHPPALIQKLPNVDERLTDTIQLVCCLGLLRASLLLSHDDIILEPSAQQWIQTIEKDTFEQDRLCVLATDVVRVFKRDEFKGPKAVAEVVYLAQVLERDDYRYLLKELYLGICQSNLLEYHQLEGLARLIQNADPGHLDADDLVKILQLLNERLRGTHYQSSHHMYQLTTAVSQVLDAMADAEVKDLDREKLHEPLSAYLKTLCESSDPYLVYQAAYAYQALQYVPDNETPWQAAMRRTGKVIRGVSGLVSAVKGVDLNGFVEGLKDIQQGLAGASDAIRLATTAIGDVTSVVHGGQGFVKGLKEGLSFDRKRAWYPALRMASTLLQNGQVSKFRELICEVPCRRDPAFQWGVCQQLGEMAANPTWDRRTRHDAIDFLGAIYRGNVVLGQGASLREWIVIILMRLASSSDKNVQGFAGTLVQELESNSNFQEQSIFQMCRGRDLSSYPLRVDSILFATPSLLDRAQNKPDVEGHLRQLMKQRLKENVKSVYISPQAKAGLQASDNARFPLMDRVIEFLNSDQNVFLLLGDSGAGKSTFNRALECDLWQIYKKGAAIPLHINLPAIDKPEQDMVAKQLRRLEFTESQIRELKVHRKFILICDGYDESQQTHNLYVSNRLNQPGEWNAKMVITCRSEYVGVDYRDRFRPGDRNLSSETSDFQEAVITPFSAYQIHEYVDQYVSIHQLLWEAKEYKEALDRVPSLKELVKNPFLMSLSLEVLPRMMDPGQGLTATRITKVALYDQFVEHWLERGKKRLGEKELNPQARSTFESLCDEGFTKNGIDFMKRLAVAIYREQDGQPIIEYSRYKDEGSWKAEFFSREDKQLLREASPLTRNGNQHRFIHRTLLEYGLTRAIFDPQDWKENVATQSSMMNRRGSTSSVWSFEIHDPARKATVVVDNEPDVDSPLMWRSFVSDPSVLQFLEERAQQEPVFMRQLVNYIEHSKLDKKWRTAAANAITILVRANVEFRFCDLKGIQIPGADLSSGVFESIQLQGADLRKVNFRNTWLRNTDLSGTQLSGARFGELPFLVHTDPVISSTCSPDGSTLAVGLENGSFAVFKTSNWEKTCMLKSHTRSVASLAYSPDGREIVSSSHDMSVRLSDVETGICHHTLTGHTDNVSRVVYSPCSDVVASGSLDMTVRLWDVVTGHCLHILTGHTAGVVDVAYSPKGHQVVSGSRDYTLRLWNVETGECYYTLTGHSQMINRVLFSPQGDMIGSTGDDETIRIWDAETGECRHVLTWHKFQVTSLVFSPNSGQLASGCRDGVARLWDLESGECCRTLLGHRETVNSVAYSTQGDQIITASFDRTVRLWDVESGECLHKLTGHDNDVLNAFFIPESSYIASASMDGTVRLWDVGSEISRTVSNCHSECVNNVKLSPEGRQVASCSKDGRIRLWDATSGSCQHILNGHKGSIFNIEYSPRGDILVSSSADKTVRLWDVERGVCLRILSGHNQGVNGAVFSIQGDQLASCSEDKTLRLWDVGTGMCSQILPGHGRDVNVVICSPQGRQVASCSSDKTVRLWDTERGECQHVLAGHTDRVTCIVYSPQGNQIASGSDDYTVRLWDVQTGKCVRVLNHTMPIASVVFSPLGNQIASACASLGTVWLWDTETEECHRLQGHSEYGTNGVAYSPGGNLIVCGYVDGRACLWDTKTSQLYNTFVYDRGMGAIDKITYRVTLGNFTWMTLDATDTLVSGGIDGSVRLWKVVKEDDTYTMRLLWRTTTGQLTVQDACIQDAKGLSLHNEQLLTQRGAVGKVMNMVSVKSELDALSNNQAVGSSSLIVSQSVELLEHPME